MRRAGLGVVRSEPEVRGQEVDRGAEVGCNANILLTSLNSAERCDTEVTFYSSDFKA